jgi:NTE family protein
LIDEEASALAQNNKKAHLPRVAIACQGGGSHAAFGAGIMHRLLDDHGRKFHLSALSGTSGGAVNAVLTWSGLIQGGPAEAQSRLRGMWEDLGAREPADVVRNWWGQVLLSLPFTWEVSPYVWDLGAREEMTARLKSWANLEALPKDPARLNDPTLLVGATDILNGVSVAIRGDGETMTRQKQMAKPAPEPFDYDDVIASLAIPPLYKDVERRGTALWDGLFSVNPPIYALTTLNPKPEEIWVIQINPQRTRSAPKSMRDIVDRRNELGGNVSLNKELDMIETINGMLRSGHLSGNHHYMGITIRMVGIEEDEDALDLAYASKFNRRPDFLRRLFDLGRDRAPRFYEDGSLRDQFIRRLTRSARPAR